MWSRRPAFSIRPKPDQILRMPDKYKFNIDKEPFIIEP